jgi:hypothetical protein
MPTLRTIVTVEALAWFSPHSICAMEPAVNLNMCSSNTERTVTIMAWHQQQPPLIVLMEDPIIHTDEHPLCSIDPTCLCHEDPELISEVQAAVEQGLITPEEATLIIQGKTL